MKGWGAQDDFQEQQKATIDDGVAQAREALKGNGTLHCVECGKKIPDRRRKAMPNATKCVTCQESGEE